MDYTLLTSPQDTVQFISIFSYLNALSDFLFLENYVEEFDQSKQIPVVNSLYQYLEDHRDNQTMKLKLIRHLLKGSDLYGEEEDENVDATFVNAMFEYIISSLVFDKYGNIYGFLADVVRKAKTLQLNSLREDIITNLRSATFENEYGERSTLTSLAVNRIFKDIILPLFPQTNDDRYLFSLDYIYAQAGSMFLRPGKINNVYYNYYQNFTTTTVLNDDYLFDEYVTTGIIIENYLLHIETSSLQAFALPALFLYAYSEFDPSENIINLMSGPSYWKAAYKNLFSYLSATFNEIKNQLKNDNVYQMHTRFLTFQSYSEIAENLLNQHCQLLKMSAQEIHSKILNFFKVLAKTFCNKETITPIVNIYINSSVKDISKLYKKDYLKNIHQLFENYFFRSLEHTNVTIHLLAPSDNIVQGVFDNVSRLSYDLFEFYYPRNKTADYYALIRENYTTTLIKDNSVDFISKTGLTFQSLLKHKQHRILLKSSSQTMNIFWEKFMNHKQQRLEAYLRFYDTDQFIGEWWKEFGLSLVPFYPCLRKAKQTNNCTLDDIQFLDQFDKDMSSTIIEKDTQKLLSSSGTSIKTIFLKNLINSKISSIFEATGKQPLHTETYMDQVFDKLSSHIEESGFENGYIGNETLTFFHKVLSQLRNNINYPFTSIEHITYNMQILRNDLFRNIHIIGTRTRRVLYIKYLFAQDQTGYGYKFIHLKGNTIAQLRTTYEQSKKLFVLLDHIEPNGEKIYLTVSNDTFKIEPHYVYAINNKIRSSKKSDLFSVIFTQLDNNEKCDSEIHGLMHIEECPRLERLTEKGNHIEECVEFAFSRNANLSRQQILNVIEQFTFPDENRIDMHFIDGWTNTPDLKVPHWSKRYIINNSTLLSDLRFKSNFEKPNLTISDGTFKINSIYTFRKRQIIENRVCLEASLESIVENYNYQKARYVVTFEDYYAIRNFAITGYTRITRDTSEAKLMKTALYKLAIRQSDEPDEEFDSTLFLIESKPIHIVNNIFSLGNKHILKKFSTTYVNKIFAINSAVVAISGYINILYEMKFIGPYLRAKIRQSPNLDEKVAILLPGTKFTIDSIESTQLTKLGDCLKVTLSYHQRSNDKFEWYKSIMKEISQITPEK